MFSTFLLSAALTLSTPAETASDYFPTQPGWKWTYREEMGATAAEVIDVAKGEREQVGRKVMVFETLIRGASQGEMSYLLTDRDVMITWISGTQPLATPYTVFQLPGPSGATSWTFDGPVPTDPTMIERLQLKGTAKKIGKVVVLDRGPVDAVEVTLDMTLGTGDIVTKINQVSVYGKGIGLVNMRETARIGRQMSERRRTLTALSTPQT